jgi:ribosomal-protein-alanine N-acetyltransferase
MRHVIETERLLLQPLVRAEAAALHALWTLAEVRRHLWDDRVVSLEETGEIIDRSEQLFTTRSFGLWSVRARGLTPLIGFGGYWYFREPPDLELIIGLHPQWWHRGLATEVGRALMRHGFDVLAFAVIGGSADAANAASLRLMRRLGMQRQGRKTVAGLDTVFYAVSRDQWQPLPPAPARCW